MANAGRKLNIPTKKKASEINDLYIWVMDSGCTCHMTPYMDDFVAGSMITTSWIIEVADSNIVPAKLQGSVRMKILNDDRETISLRIEGVLYVPELSRQLFSLMSLMDQGHLISLSKKHGVQILFEGESAYVTFPMPNYHLFASNTIDLNANINKLEHNSKTKEENTPKSIDLDLLYRQFGCRSIKTLLSANQSDVWKDVTINVNADLISTSDHHIATIRKKNRNKIVELDPTLEPGQVVCFGIVSNPSKNSLTTKAVFIAVAWIIRKTNVRN